MSPDLAYAAGVECTWNDVLGLVRMLPRLSQVPPFLVVTRPCCPRCGGEVREISLEEWQSQMREAAKQYPDAEAIMRWSRGRCFPDFETLENAWRQAMEE